MKIILEKSEVLSILGKHFDTVLDPEKVVIRTDPQLEIELCGISMNEGEKTPVKKPPVVESPVQVAEEIAAIVEQSNKHLRRSDRNTLTSVPDSIADEL